MKYEVKRLVTRELKKVFVDPNLKLDFMGYLLDEDNHPTYHHIEKACDLKARNEFSEATFDNGALLGKRSHEFLHQIELADRELYIKWNELFLLINRCRNYPSDELWSLVFELKEYSENLYKGQQKKR